MLDQRFKVYSKISINIKQTEFLLIRIFAQHLGNLNCVRKNEIANMLLCFVARISMTNIKNLLTAAY